MAYESLRQNHHKDDDVAQQQKEDQDADQDTNDDQDETVGRSKMEEKDPNRSVGGTHSSDDDAEASTDVVEFDFADPDIGALFELLESNDAIGFGDEMLLMITKKTFAKFVRPQSDTVPQLEKPLANNLWRSLLKKHVSVLPANVQQDRLQVGHSTAAGNCLFSSVSLALFDRPDDVAAKWLRARCVFELVDQIDSYRALLGGEAVRDILVTLLGGKGTRDAELDALLLLSNVVQRRLVICSKQRVCSSARKIASTKHSRSLRPSGGALRCRLCAMPTVIDEETGEAIPLQQDAGFLNQVDPIDEKLMRGLEEFPSLLPTHAVSVDCISALCAQICNADYAACCDILIVDDNNRDASKLSVVGRRTAMQLVQDNMTFAVLCRDTLTLGEETDVQHWLIALVSSQTQTIEWCSSLDAFLSTSTHAGKRRAPRSRADDRMQLQRALLMDSLSQVPLSETWTWEKFDSAKPKLEFRGKHDASLWAVALLWCCAFGSNNSLNKSLRLQIDGSTRLGCAVALVYADSFGLDENRAPPMRVLSRRSAASESFCWIARWRALTSERAKFAAIDEVQLSEESV